MGGRERKREIRPQSSQSSKGSGFQLDPTYASCSSDEKEAMWLYHRKQLINFAAGEVPTALKMATSA